MTIVDVNVLDRDFYQIRGIDRAVLWLYWHIDSGETGQSHAAISTL